MEKRIENNEAYDPVDVDDEEEIEELVSPSTFLQAPAGTTRRAMGKIPITATLL